jgi:hypothetical protein
VGVTLQSGSREAAQGGSVLALGVGQPHRGERLGQVQCRRPRSARRRRGIPVVFSEADPGSERLLFCAFSVATPQFASEKGCSLKSRPFALRRAYQDPKPRSAPRLAPDRRCRTASIGRLLLGDCASQRITAASRGRRLLSAPVVAAERIRASDPLRPAVRALQGSRRWRRDAPPAMNAGVVRVDQCAADPQSGQSDSPSCFRRKRGTQPRQSFIPAALVSTQSGGATATHRQFRRPILLSLFGDDLRHGRMSSSRPL